MSIKKLKRIFAFTSFGFGLFLMGSQGLMAAPTAITDLSGQEGQNPGEVTLQWTEPMTTVSEYQLRYRATSVIDTESKWLAATFITPPTVGTPGSTRTFTVNGLTPGVDYGFNLRYKVSSLLSDLSISSPPASLFPAKDACGAGTGDGEGSASVSPTSFPNGDLVHSTITFTVGSSGIAQGGFVEVVVPDFWTLPQKDSSNSAGYVAVAHNQGGGVTLQLRTSTRSVIAEVQSGSLNSGTVLSITYKPQQCDYSPTARFRVYSQGESCGTPTEIASSPLAVTPTAGTAERLVIIPYNQTILVNTPTKINITAVDYCYQEAPVTGSRTINLEVKSLNSNGALITDPYAQLDSSLGFGSPVTSLSVNITTGNTKATFYYQITSTNQDLDHYVDFQYTELSPEMLFTDTGSGDFEAISGGITNATVDTGSIGSLTSVTISPDGDGTNDDAFINFTLPQNLSWKVEISSDGFQNMVREFYGFGSNNRVFWDGRFEHHPDTVPPGTYAVRIKMNGDAIQNNSLSVVVTANGISTIIQDQGSSPLSNADINVFGPTGHFTRSGTDGSASIYGLKAGERYTIEVRRDGYGAKRFDFTATAGTLNLGAIQLQVASQLRIAVARPEPYDQESFGNFEAHNSDWTKFESAPAHFSVGKATSDAGDFFNTNLTTYSVLNLEPNVEYTVELRMRGFSMTPTTFTLTSGETRNALISLSRASLIQGTIAVPTAVTDSNGFWISVEACKGGDCDSFNARRFHGGGVIPQGNTQGFYEILGIEAGTYEVKTYAPGYVSTSTQVVVTNGSDATVNISTLSVGGSISGTLTVTGDSTNLDQMDGTTDGVFSVWVNARNSDGTGESFTQLNLSTNATSASSTYTLTGLNDGTVRIFSWLPGFRFDSGGAVTLSGGSLTKNLSFSRFSGSIQGDILLNAGATHYDEVEVTIQPVGDPGRSGSIYVNVSTVGTPSYSAQYLGTGFYKIKGFDKVTGISFTQETQIIEGQLSDIDIVLQGDTYSISGTVQTDASDPYDSISYIVNNATDTSVLNTLIGTGTVQDIPVNRVIAEKIDVEDFLFNDGPEPMGDDTNASSTYPEFDPTEMFYAEYSASAGTYTISNLSPGVYQLYVNPELTNSQNDGQELARVNQIVTILDSNLTGKNFTLIDGYDVSGTINLSAGLSETGRTLAISVIDKDGEEVGEKQFVYLTGTSGSFTVERVPPGLYVVKVQDDQIPQKYSSREVSIEVKQQDLTGVSVTLKKTGKVTGQIRLVPSGIILTEQNYDSYLGTSFGIEARANPWFQGGFHNGDHPIINSSGKFNVNVNPGTFDVLFRNFGFIGETGIAQGQKQFVPKTVSGVTVRAGETKDLGVIDLIEGETITGTVKDANGNVVPNVFMSAEDAVSESHNTEPLTAFTDENGVYTIYGIDPGTADRDGTRYYNVYAAKRPRGGESVPSISGDTKYAETRKYIDTRNQTTVNFTLTEAKGGIRGRVKTPDNGPLVNPFKTTAIPAAEIFANKEGDIPIDNPIGDIQVLSEPDGDFLIDALAPGNYKIVGLAGGYGSAVKKDIIVSDSIVDIGTITFTSGFKLSGTLSKPDGSAPNTSEIETLIGVRNGFEELLIGSIESDASGNITAYAVTGFQSGKTYKVLALASDSDDLTDLGNVTLTANEERDFIIRPKAPDIFASATLGNNSAVTINFEYSGSLSNSETDLDNNGIADVSDPAKLFIVTTGEQSRLTYDDDNWLSSNRKRASLTYTPASGETSFVIRSSATFTQVDPDTGLNFTRTKNFTFYLGISGQKSKKLLNASAGALEFSDDGAGFTSSAGTFGLDDSSLEVEVTLRKAASLSDVVGTSAASQKGLGIFQAAELVGYQAYPGEMSSAMLKAQALDLDPLSSFYDIFLPASVSHFFPEGKEAQICLAYDSSVTDPSSLNIYYYSETTNEYLLENQNRRTDTENNLICADISHASVFSVFSSSDSVLTGGGYTGPYNVMSFPNPFNLKNKTITLQNPGALNASQTIEGTMIKISVPAGMGGSAEIEIFNVLGEEVRTINVAITEASHNYVEWNGRNESGKKVASGVYIARLTLNGGNEKFFKMAVVK